MMQASIRPATPADIPAIMHFLKLARWVTLESSLAEVEKRIPDWPCWLLTRGEDVEAFLLVDIRRYPVAQIHTVACAGRVSLSADVSNLLAVACQYGHSAGTLPLVYIGDTSWLSGVLERYGFQQVNRVIFYEKEGQEIPSWGNLEVDTRPVNKRDIGSLVALDEAAFESQWRNNAPFFADALSAFPHFVVAVLENRIVGYQFSALYKSEGHLARLAVHPLWQRRGIGTRLLAEAIAFLQRSGARAILLNTQEDNWRAQRLYRRFGFYPTGERLLVWQENRQ